jgi:hypothetical protein
MTDRHIQLKHLPHLPGPVPNGFVFLSSAAARLNFGI